MNESQLHEMNHTILPGGVIGASVGDGVNDSGDFHVRALCGQSFPQ